MAKTLFSILSDPEAMLALEPEELAGIILEHLNSLPENERNQINRFNYAQPHTVMEYPEK